MLTRLSALIVLIVGPAMADTIPPSEPQIIAALVRQAHQIEVVDHAGRPVAGVSASGFLTQVIYEIGHYAPQSNDRYSLSAGCEVSGAPGDWECELAMSVHWSGAESAWTARFALTPGMQQCEPLFIDVHGEYDPCAWVIRDGQMSLLLAG